MNELSQILTEKSKQKTVGLKYIFLKDLSQKAREEIVAASSVKQTRLSRATYAANLLKKIPIA